MGTTLVRFMKRWLLAFLLPRPLIGLFYVPRYFRHWWRYRRSSRGEIVRFRDTYPCLTDWTAYTPFDAHYFYQAAWLARRLRASAPARHVDVASSAIAVGTISAITDTVFIDYRPLHAKLSGLQPVGGDVTRLPLRQNAVESLSCLHVIEHIGLGRYGDPIDALGAGKAARELERVLQPGGRLYLSVPVGRERVCFNAHRVFAPATVIGMFPALVLKEFSFVDDRGVLQESLGTDAAAECEYACGMFVLEKQIQT